MIADKTYKLVGFAVDIGGNEDHLVLAEPVVQVDTGFYVARSTAWARQDLKLVEANERKFITWLPADFHRGISEGEFVWVAGRGFSAALHSSFLRKFSLQLSEWQVFRKGIRWTTGTRRHFLELHLELSAAIERALGVYLFDHLEKSMGSAEEMIRIYEGLAVPATRDRYVWRGIFYHEQDRQFRAYRTTARLAARSKLFSSAEDFDEEVQRRLAWLTRARLSERTPVASSIGPESGQSDIRRTAEFTWLVTALKTNLLPGSFLVPTSHDSADEAEGNILAFLGEGK